MRRIVIDGIETNYKVNVRGEVFNAKTNRKLKPRDDSTGYFQVAIYLNGRIFNCRVHRLVAIAYIPNPDNLPQVNHIDSNRSNNALYNLEWVTPKENIAHMDNQNRRNAPRGRKHGMSKLTENEVVNIRKLYAENVYTLVQLSQMYGVRASHLSDIVRRKLWRHV